MYIVLGLGKDKVSERVWQENERRSAEVLQSRRRSRLLEREGPGIQNKVSSCGFNSGSCEEVFKPLVGASLTNRSFAVDTYVHAPSVSVEAVV